MYYSYEMKTSMYKTQKLLIHSSIFSSIMIVMSSNSFLGIWIGMELNLFIIIPMFMMEEEKNSDKSMMVYFLIQTISSIIMLISILSNTYAITITPTKILFYLSLLMKMGTFPFHHWVIKVMSGTSWSMAFVILTIQKLFPMFVILLTFDIYFTKFLIFLCIINSIVASLSGLNTFSLRKMMGFSSMNHLSFLILSMIISKKMFKIYFLSYTLMTLAAVKTFKKFNMSFIFQSFTLNNPSKITSLSMLLIFLSLSGIPPFLGFIPKFLVIAKMIEINLINPLIFIILSNTMATFFYLRLCMPNLLMNLNKEPQKFMHSSSMIPVFLILLMPIPMII